MESDTLLEIEDLNVVYTSDNIEVHAVNGISLNIKVGETLGLVGETGAGKTTTALSIMRLLPERTGKVKAGSVVFCGKNLQAVSPLEMKMIRGSRIAMIYQDPMSSLNPVMPVGKQIREVLEIHNDQKDRLQKLEDRVDELLSLVGIQPTRKHDFPHQLSGGMKQRVVIAMALACKPELLIADEPTTALDVTIQAQVLRMIRELKDKLGTAMLLITHDLGVVAQTCDNVAIMYAGRIVEKGSLHAVFEGNIHHPYTRGLFQSIPDIAIESERLVPIDGLMPDPANLPGGCAFHPRCKHVLPICRNTAPYQYARDGHYIECHLYNPTGG